MVVVIMGIVGAMVVPQMLHAGTLTIQAAARIIVADMLYAQNDAIAKQTGRRLVFSPAQNRYQLQDLGGTTLSVPWKNGGTGNYVIDFTEDSRFQGVRIAAADFSGTSTLTFDALGAPMTGGTVDLVYKDSLYRVTIAAFTGRVTVGEVVGP